MSAFRRLRRLTVIMSCIMRGHRYTRHPGYARRSTDVVTYSCQGCGEHKTMEVGEEAHALFLEKHGPEIGE